MPLFEYFCEICQQIFEEVSVGQSCSEGYCPHCNVKSAKKMISRFAVGGQGDLRDSTQQGCHGCSHQHSSNKSSHSE